MGGMTLGKSPEQMMREREAIDSAVNPARRQRDADLRRVAEGMDIGPDGALKSVERGLGPALAAQRLEESDIDVPAFVKQERFKKKQTQGLAKGGAVSSASSRGDGCITKGHTKGKMR